MKMNCRLQPFAHAGAIVLSLVTSAAALAQWGPYPPPSSTPATTASSLSANPGYKVTDLDGDQAHVAAHTDPLLVNPWGIVLVSDMLVVADNGAGLLTSYAPGGTPARKAILVPPPAGSPGPAAPDGLALLPSRDFLIGQGAHKKPAQLLIATEDGTVSAWNASSGTNAVLVIDHSSANAVYKGLAVGRATNGSILYVANFRSNVIEMFDTNFAFLGSFADTNLTVLGFAPFNLRIFQDKLVAAFAKQDAQHHDDVPGAGFGYIDVFNLDGALVRNFAAQGALNSPWALAIAPSRFGKFSHALLIGNFGDGWINAYNLFTGEYLGALADASGKTIVIPGLWGLTFNMDPGGDDLEFMATTLYFTAGPNGEADGVLGSIKPVSPLDPPVH